MLPQTLSAPPHQRGVSVSSLLIAAYMQNPLTQIASTLHAHTPVTRLIDALKEAGPTDEEKLSRVQMWSGGLGFFLALLGLILFVIYEHSWKEPWLVAVSLGAVGGGTIGSVIFTVFGTREIWQGLKRFELDALSEADPRISARYRLAQRIGAEFDAKQIAFARDQLRAGCQNLRSRIGMGIGALEKIGIIPLAASTLVALAKMYGGSPFATLWCAGALVLLLFYLGAIRILGAAQTIERLLLVLDHAEAYAAERSPRRPPLNS